MKIKDYNKALNLVEEHKWDELVELMESLDMTPEELYVELANDRCKKCRASQCNYCSIYEFDSNYVDNDTLYEMGYLDEEYCFKFN